MGTVVSGPNRITYTDVDPGGAGGLVGPGASPSAAPGASAAGGTFETAPDVELGTHQYAVTFVTAAGESLAGPTVSIMRDSISAPSTPLPLSISDATGSIDPGEHTYAMCWVSDYGFTMIGPTASIVIGASGGKVLIEQFPDAPGGIDTIDLFRTVAGGAQWKWLSRISTNAAFFLDSVSDASLPDRNLPVSNTSGPQRVALADIPIGASSVISRNVYRTEAGGSQLKLLASIADNLTTTYTDSTADAGLGADAPIIDLSGLEQSEGIVLPGATSVVVANPSVFRAAGGWAVIGNGQQCIRYTGKTGSTLTGIPATGPGAITAAIGYNSTITAAPCLIGIPSSGEGSVRHTIAKGAEVNMLVQVDDADAQAVISALLTSDEGGVHDGVIEEYIQDRRLSYDEAYARGLAFLELHSEIEVSIRYVTKDRNTRSGHTISVTLSAPAVSADFTIQSVTINRFSPGLAPTYTVEASSKRFTFEQLLALVRSSRGG